MKEPWHICVLIPARNKEEILPRCLTSVLRARRKLPAEITCDIVVIVDASTDRTACIAQSMLSGCGIVAIVDAGIVGSARAYAATIAVPNRADGTKSLGTFGLSARYMIVDAEVETIENDVGRIKATSQNQRVAIAVGSLRGERLRVLCGRRHSDHAGYG